MEKHRPLVSIIMPFFNCEKYIEQAIESVLNQTYAEWELLLCDDGSTDRTRHKALSFTDHRIKFFGATDRLGAFGAKNFLLEKASGEFITFLDADDYMDFWKIELQINEFLDNKHLGIVGCQMAEVSIDGTVLRVSSNPLTHDEITASIYKRNVIGGAYMMIKREALQQVGGRFREYFQRLSYQDYDLSVLIAERYPCCNLPAVLYYYRQHSTSTSKKVSVDRYIARDVVSHLALQRKKDGADDLMRGRPDLVEAYFKSLRRPYQKDRSLIYRKYAANYVYNRLFKKAVSVSWQAIRIEPFKLSNWRTLQYCFRIFVLSKVTKV